MKRCYSKVMFFIMVHFLCIGSYAMESVNPASNKADINEDNQKSNNITQIDLNSNKKTVAGLLDKTSAFINDKKRVVQNVGAAGIAIGTALYQLMPEEDKSLKMAMIYLQSKEGQLIPLPVHFTNQQFQKKIIKCNGQFTDKKVIIDCSVFSYDTLKLAAEILIYEAGKAYAKSTQPFPFQKIHNYLDVKNKNITIDKAKNLLRALAFFHLNTYFDLVLQKCEDFTGYDEKELFFLQKDLINELKRNNMGALDILEEDFHNQKPEIEDYTEKEVFNLFNVSPQYKREIAFDLLKNKVGTDPYIPVVDPYVMDKETSDELDIMSGSGDSENNYFAQSISRCDSELGKVLFFTKLLQPTDRIEEIKNNQEILGFLLDNKDTLASINKSFNDFFKEAQNENALLSFLSNDPSNRLLVNEIEKSSNVNRWVNASENVNTVFSAKDQIRIGITNWITTPTEWIHKECPQFSRIFGHVLDVAFYIPGPLFKLNASTVISGLAQNVVAAIVKDIKEKKGSDLPVEVQNFLQNEAQGLMGTFWHSLKRKKCGSFNYTRLLYEKVVAIAEFISFAQKVNHELKKMPGIYKKLPVLEKLNVLSQDEDFKVWNYLWEDPNQFDNVLAKLSSKVFAQKDLMWVNTRHGKIIATHYLLYLHREKILEIYSALAELDVYLSLSRSLGGATTKHPFCFAQLVNSETPIMDFRDLWNPMLGENAVSNNIKLGGVHPKDAIITGRNTGGKSTFLRSIIFAVLLAQKFGICPAGSAIITPFSNIRAYANITDDAAKNKSLFQASAQRAKELLRVAQKPGHALLAFDELYNGTNEDGGDSLAYGTVKKINGNSSKMSQFNEIKTVKDYLSQVDGFKNTISIASTHYPFVADLREELDQNFAYLRACDSEDGNENYFKIIPGIYDTFNSIDVAKKINIDPNIIDDAKKRHAKKQEKQLHPYLVNLELLHIKEAFDRYMALLNEKDIKTIDSLKKIALTLPYNSELFNLAKKHNYDVKKLINFQDQNGRTLLHRIALRDIKQKEIIDSLLANGADVAIKDIKGNKPIDYALANSIKAKLEEQKK